jgi:hypothetical protein
LGQSVTGLLSEAPEGEQKRHIPAFVIHLSGITVPALKVDLPQIVSRWIFPAFSPFNNCNETRLLIIKKPDIIPIGFGKSVKVGMSDRHTSFIFVNQSERWASDRGDAEVQGKSPRKNGFAAAKFS